MSHIRIDAQLLDHYKRSLGVILPGVKSSHRMEGLAAGFDFRQYASLTAARNEAGGELVLPFFSLDSFERRLEQLGYVGVELPIEAIQSLFSYRTYVACKNGFSFEAVHALASMSGHDANTSTIFAEMLCWQPLLEGEFSILPQEQVRSILGLVPRMSAPPLTSLNLAERELLSRDPFCTNPGAALAMWRITEWSVKLELGRNWAALPIVRAVRSKHDEVEISFLAESDGLRVLRMAQDALNHVDLSEPKVEGEILPKM